ncbi:MAG TPA: diguanylate cyclase [Thermoanaerobaculia bacterium]|nr:diguanylate cyclase [Thermoanaerobaculia bacterium]
MVTSPTAIGIGEDTLTRRRRAAQSNQTSAPFRIVLVEDDPAIVRLLAKVLGTAGMEVTACSTGAEGLAVIDGQEWEICVLDRGLPDFDGIEICRHVKANARFDARRVIMLSGYDSLAARVEALNLGADDYITKPFHPAELLARINASRRVVEMQQQLVDMAQQLEELSGRDDLTGIFNRRHFGTMLDRAFAQSHRYRRPLSVAIIDIDHFKDINDSFGHQAGDVVLAEVAKRFSRSVRSSDYLARYGGEEFVVLLPETQLDDAVSFGEKLRTEVSAAPVPIDGERALTVTVSVGAASLAHTEFKSPSEMIWAADQALYRAKRNGRNRVEAERRRAQRTRVSLSA